MASYEEQGSGTSRIAQQRWFKGGQQSVINKLKNPSDEMRRRMKEEWLLEEEDLQELALIIEAELSK